MENSNIEWCDNTFNPVRGCTRVSDGCKNCYAAREAVRFPGIRGIWGDSGTRIVAVPDAWKVPVKWNRQAELEMTLQARAGSLEAYRRPRVFCASLADVFEDWKGDLRFPADIAPEGWVTARWDGKQLVRELEESADAQGLVKATMDHLRQELFELIEATPHLDWLLLTKRPENVMRMVPASWQAAFPGNVWMGTTVENQKMADLRIPELLKIPAKVRFLSCEPLLGPVNLKEALKLDDGNRPLFSIPPVDHIDWVICGGESGPNARPMHPDWARAVRDQCKAAAVPFLFKQWGEWCPGEVAGDYLNPEKEVVGLSYFDGKWVEDISCPDAARENEPDVYRIGKKKSGRLLDGMLHNRFPYAIAMASADEKITPKETTL
jgi:protein gp37